MMGMNIPPHALERLKGLRSRDNAEGIFTSDFTVNEFLLVRKAGFEPVGLCVGSCIYQVGFQLSSWSRVKNLQFFRKPCITHANSPWIGCEQKLTIWARMGLSASASKLNG